jgi:ComF family protein
MNMLRKLMKGLIDVVFPRVCLACRQPAKEALLIDNLICAQCWGKIKKNPPPFCHCCGKHLKGKHLVKNICGQCLKGKLHFDRAFSPCLYEGVAKELIHQFKYKNKEHLGRPLSRLMIEFIREYNVPMEYVDVIVPVPLHKSRLYEREFNQAHVLSKPIAEEFGKRVLADVLIRHRRTKTQTDLEERERFLNVQGSFSIVDRKKINGANCLLIDDVLTTGATASEAASVLKNAGAHIVFVLTLVN